MKEILLTKGHVALVDDEDFDAVNAFNWSASVRISGTVYAKRGVRKPDGAWTSQFMHQFLLPETEYIDHIDGDGRNNQRHNIRPSTKKQNRQSFQRKRAGCSSSFRGVSWCGDRNKWRGRIGIDGRLVSLGLFINESEAARAYDEAARKYFGDRAAPNFP